MLIDIRKIDKPINGISNGGTMVTDREGDLPGFFTVYYNPKSLMNISAFCDTRRMFRTTMDTSKEVDILVHIGENKIMRFLEIGASLYLWKPEDNSNFIDKQTKITLS